MAETFLRRVAVLFAVVSALGASSPTKCEQLGLRPGFSVGESVPTLEGVSLDGKPVTVNWATQLPSVVYVITPNGAMVSRNEGLFAALTRETAGKYRFIVVSTVDDGLAPYIAKVSPGWGKANITVLGGITDEVKKRMRLGSYPYTLVVSKEGKASFAMGGAYLGDNAREVESFFKIKLPAAKQ